MAVIKDGFLENEGKIKVTNGDFQALRTIANEYGLSDEADVIVFALGVLVQTRGRGVIIERDDGSTLKLVPSDKLRSKQA